MFIEASYPRLPNDRAILTLPHIFKTGPRCELRFWYHMMGSGIGSLKAIAKDHSGKVIASWRKYGEQSAQWLQGGLYLPHADDVTITFEAVRGNNYQGDIALDDIEFVNCDMGCECYLVIYLRLTYSSYFYENLHGYWQVFLCPCQLSMVIFKSFSLLGISKLNLNVFQ